MGFPIAVPDMRIGLLGGSFDPAHEGHAHITRWALRLFGLDRVWWLVSPGNPLKAHGPAPMSERLQQARRIMQDPRVEISDLELRLGTQMTADTIGALRRHYPHVRFVWLMGADNMVQFHLWDAWRDIALQVPIGVIARPGSRMAARHSVAARMLARSRLSEQQARLLPLADPPAWALVNIPLNSQSSTSIRATRQCRAERAGA